MDPGKDNVLVCAGCLIFIPQAYALPDTEDAVNTLLYMQLAASKRHSRFTESGRWDDRFMRAIVTFGWALKGDASSTRTLPSSPATVWDWIESDLPVFLPVDAVISAQKTAHDCYLSLPDQPAIHLYASQVQERAAFSAQLSGNQDQRHDDDAVAGTRVSLQLAFPGPDLSLCIVKVSFTSRIPLKPDFMFQPIAAQDVSGKIELTFCLLQRHEQEFSLNRGQITAALASRSEALISPLQEAANVQQ